MPLPRSASDETETNLLSEKHPPELFANRSPSGVKLQAVTRIEGLTLASMRQLRVF